MIVQNLEGRKSDDLPSLRFVHLPCSASHSLNVASSSVTTISQDVCLQPT